MKAASCAAILLVCLAVSSASATVAEHPDFTENRERPVRILLLPVQSSITRGRLTDAQSLIEETRVLEQAFAREAEAAWRALGYELDTATVSAEALASDRRLLAVMDEARDRAMESLAQASRDPKGIAEGRFTIDDAALPLGVHAQAEGLLVLQSQSLIVSKGSKALGFVFNPLNLASTATRTQVVGGLFDMRDGQLLVLLEGRDVGPVLKNPDKVARAALASALKGFPPRGTSRQAKPKFREEAALRRLSPLPALDEDSEAAALAAFEELAAAGEASGDRDAPSSEPREPIDPTDPTESLGSTDDEELDIETDEPLARDQQAALRRLIETPPQSRPKPSLQAVFVGATGPTGLTVRNMNPAAVRVSVDAAAFVLLEPGERLELEARAGSRRLLVASADEDRELVRAAVIVREGRVAIAELWPSGD